MEYRNHPVVEGLRINEDGTSIIFNKVPLAILETHMKHHVRHRKTVAIFRKTVTVIRLVCEAWHGMPQSRDFAARRVDETKGDHYSNLFWGKVGVTLGSNDYNNRMKRNRKMTKEVYDDINRRAADPKETIKAICAELKITTKIYYDFRKKYENQ